MIVLLKVFSAEKAYCQPLLIQQKISRMLQLLWQPVATINRWALTHLKDAELKRRQYGRPGRTNSASQSESPKAANRNPNNPQLTP